jgi:hypothetical protein
MHVCDICANPLDRVDNQENNVTNERIAIRNIDGQRSRPTTLCAISAERPGGLPDKYK